MSARWLAGRALIGLALGSGLALAFVALQVGHAAWSGQRACWLPHHPAFPELHAPVDVRLLLGVPLLAGAGQWLAVVTGSARDARRAPRHPPGPPGPGPLRVAVCAIHAQALGALLLSLGLWLFDLAGLCRALEGRLPGIDASRWQLTAAGSALLLAFALLLGTSSLLPRPRRLSPLQVVLVSLSTSGGGTFWSIAGLVYLGVIR